MSVAGASCTDVAVARPTDHRGQSSRGGRQHRSPVRSRAPADGYAIVLGTNTHAINMSLYAKPGYDLVKDSHRSRSWARRLWC